MLCTKCGKELLVSEKFCTNCGQLVRRESIAKKLLGILLVHRVETENKWWHRLFTVLLFSSGALVLLLTIFSMMGDYNTNWVSYHPVAFSLESNYQQASGSEMPCKDTIDWSSSSAGKPVITIIQCDGVNLTSVEAGRYDALYTLAYKNLRKQYGLDKYDGTCKSTTLTPEEIACIKTSIANEHADPSYDQYQNDLNNLARIKVSQDINFGLMFSDIAFWIVIPILVLLLWIVFWSSIVYRAILYVVYGKKR